MLVGESHNGLRFRHFNEYLAQKPTTSMAQIMAHVEFYIKGEESNALMPRNKHLTFLTYHINNVGVTIPDT